MMHPVDHIVTLPSVVAAEASLQTAGRIEQMRIRRGLQRNVEALQGGRFGLEVLRASRGLIATEDPVIAGPLNEHDRCIPERRWRHFALGRLPIFPLRRCRQRQRLR